ncbi:MAG: TlpA disulfide reductase family protein [Nitrospirota bacterium]
MNVSGPAPEWRTIRWFNAKEPLTLADFRGRVVVLHAFQMLCPGCVAHGLPQAQRVAEAFDEEPVAVVGLHTVFEHHSVMGPEALEAFLHEYRIKFPIGVDEPTTDGHPIPMTMRAYQMRGTPTTILIDGLGRRRGQVFGTPTDLALGAAIAGLLGELKAS